MPITEIGTSRYADCLRERLAFELEFLKEDGIIIEIDEFGNGELCIFTCRCSFTNGELDNLTTIFKEYIANALSDVIINDLEEELLMKILKSNYRDFSDQQREEILEIAMDRLNFLISKEENDIISKIQRKNRILLEILNYLEETNEITLEGFIRFRLKDYLTELEVAIDRAVEDFVVEKEYEEFINLLKYFIDNQEAKNRLIHVVKINNGHFKLLDQNEKVVENTYLDEHILNMVDCELDYEDLLISALITAAPEEIILHFKEPISLLKTLHNVFTDKISICLGCKHCKRGSFNESE
jgi:putative sporulation protein YtxC